MNEGMKMISDLFSDSTCKSCGAVDNFKRLKKVQRNGGLDIACECRNCNLVFFIQYGRDVV